MAHNEISRDAGQDILVKLPTASDITVRELSDQTRRMAIPPSSRPTSSYDSPPGPPVRRVPPTQPQPSLQRAKALWTYNENGSVRTSPVSYLFNTDEGVFRNPMICPSARATPLRWSLKRIRIGGLASSTESKDCSPLITWRRSLPAALLPILRPVTLGEHRQLLLRRIIVVHLPRTNPSLTDRLRVDTNHSHPNPIIPI